MTGDAADSGVLELRSPPTAAPPLLAAIRAEVRSRGATHDSAAARPAPAAAGLCPLPPRPRVANPVFATAGEPVAIDRWRRRYSQPCNRRQPRAAGGNGASLAGLLRGGSTALREFLRGDFGQQPVLLDLEASVLPGHGGSGWAVLATTGESLPFGRDRSAVTCMGL